ncbi:MAG: spore cortex-lytic enzyme [Clostridia bacterium]
MKQHRFQSFQLFRFLCFFLTLVLVIVAVQPIAYAAALKLGSSGDDVIKLQKKLKSWGYFDGAADGKFGVKTEEAVKYFQRKNGLTADGVVGSATVKALGLSLSDNASGPSHSSSNNSSSPSASGDTYLLAKCIYGESRGEPYKGQVAVAAVILNRVESSKFPSSIAGVIYQPGAFSVVNDGQINLAPNDSALKAARDAMNGYDPTGGCVYYYNPDKTSNQWIRSRPIILTIGRHVFCK